MSQFTAEILNFVPMCMLYRNMCVCSIRDCTKKVSGKLRLSLAESSSELSVKNLQVPDRLFLT